MNKPTNKKLFLILISSQLLVIFVLLIWIHYKKSNVLGKSINTIKKEETQFLEGSEYKFFYEPKPGKLEIYHPTWQTSGLPIYYSINADSLNERFDYDIDKSKGTYRIVTIGDSFTFGQNVSTANNWTETLEDFLNNDYTCENISEYEVINLGVYGYDTAYQVERYRMRGQKYDPDLVIWFVTDLHRITEKYMEIYDQFAESNKDKIEEDYHYATWKNVQNLLVNKHGGKGLVDYQLNKFRKFRDNYYPSGPILFISELEEIYELGNDDIYYSGTNVFYDSKYLLPDKHFNKRGHKEFAKEVLEALIKHEISPC